MNYIPLVYALFCLSLVPISLGANVNMPTISSRPLDGPPPSLGASPLLDTTRLKLSRQMDVFTNKLLSGESRSLAEIKISGEDFRDWKNNILTKFKIRQSTLPRYSDDDRTNDLRQFTRYLNALETEFQEQQTQSRINYLKKQRQRGFQYSVDLLQKAVQKYQIAGEQLHKLEAQQADLYNECKEIGGSAGSSFDPYSGEGQLINLISNSGDLGVTSPSPAYPPVGLIPPTQWKFPDGSNPRCIGPVIFSSQSPPGAINIQYRDDFSYPDTSSKLGVLYDKIVDLCFDFINNGYTNSDYNDRILVSYKQQWNNLVVRYSRCVIKYRQVGKKKDSVRERVTNLLTFIKSIETAPFNPQDGWDNVFTNTHPSTFGPDSELSNGSLQNILMGNI